MALDESKNADQTYTVNEIDLMIDERVLPYTEGSQIDYISNAYGQGFSIAPAGGGSCC